MGPRSPKFVHRRPKQRHNAGNPGFDVVVTYPFHPLVGQTVAVVGEHDHDGICHLLVRQPHGGTFHLPDWIAAPQAGSVAIVAAPRLSLTHLLELRALLDHLVGSLPRDSISGGGHADEESAAHPTGFVCAHHTMSGEERVKAVVLLQSLLVEAASVQGVGLLIPEEGGG
ncbi:DUF5372 family protein [Mesorhizobium sp. M1295]|uniref:DUF5372 family protein n=1 Tax=Mesorhizobium sp. M1295 TaxID=2957076 RepID=UPI00333B2877